MKLPLAFKNKLVKALTSGDFEQGEQFLCNLDAPENVPTYCCLGVAAICAGVPQKELAGVNWPDEIGKNEKLLPVALRGHGKPPTEGFNCPSDKHFNPIVQKLANFNDDGGKSFKWIASYIKRYL